MGDGNLGPPRSGAASSHPVPKFVTCLAYCRSVLSAGRPESDVAASGDVSAVAACSADDLWARRAMWVSAGSAVVPIMAAVIRAIAEGWLPLSDNGYFTIRSRDVLTGHHPLIGAWSSGSPTVGTSVNNLGPLQLDLLSPFTKLSPGAGTAIAVGLTHVLAIVGIALVVRRLAGPLMTSVAMLVCTALGWLMGSAALVEPRQHTYLAFVLLCFFALAWALMDGRPWALPWTAFVGSLIVQTQLAFGLVTCLVAVVAVVSFALVSLRARGSGDKAWIDYRHRTGRYLVISSAVLIVVWLQPLIEQLFGDGNMLKVLTAPGSGDKPTSGAAMRMVASILTTPKQWVRPAFGAYAPNEDMTSLPFSLLGLGVLALVLVAAYVTATRRSDRTARVGVTTASLTVVAAIVAAHTIPIGEFGFTSDNARWLWPLTAFVAIVVLGLLAHELERCVRLSRVAGAGRNASLAVASVVGSFAIIMSVANLPASPTYVDFTLLPDRLATAKELTGQLDADEIPELVLFDRGGAYFGDPYTYVILLRLQEIDVEFTFDTPDGDTTNVDRFGDSRLDGGRAEFRLRFAFGVVAEQEQPGETRVAYVSGLDDDEQGEFGALRSAFADALRSGALVVDLDTARSATDINLTPVEAALAGDDVDPGRLSIALGQLHNEDLLTGVETIDGDLDRFVEFGKRDQFDTIALFLAPIDGPS